MAMEENRSNAWGHPPVVSYQEWHDKRLEFLKKEKALTREYDRLNAELRRMPMVKIDKKYRFTGEQGEVGLLDLFDGKIQLIIYHFMFDPEWEKGCGGCTWYASQVTGLEELRSRNTNMILVSRAPYEKLQKYKKEKGWSIPWFSSFGSEFNYDFHVTHDESKLPLEMGFKTREQLNLPADKVFSGFEDHGISVFFRVGDEIFYTYRTHSRGVERRTDGPSLLDLTPYGRQEDWEDSPAGWPQNPTYG